MAQTCPYNLYWSFYFFIHVLGNHGLGDSARIPIGNFKEVDETNGMNAYIKPKNYSYGALSVHSFTKADNYLLGKTKVSSVDRPKPFFCWNLSKDDILFFDTEANYRTYAKHNGLPNPSEFKTFRENYRQYWGGLKFWLLP